MNKVKQTWRTEDGTLAEEVWMHLRSKSQALNLMVVWFVWDIEKGDWKFWKFAGGPVDGTDSMARQAVKIQNQN